jgi:DNA-binding MarR family transcriptional regulator
MSHAQVLPLIGPEGARVGALARIQRVSRQAISTTAKDLERLGTLRRETDPRDRRGVVFRLTASGERLIEDSVAALDALDQSIVLAIGIRRVSALQKGACALYEALHLEDEVFETDRSRRLHLRGRDTNDVELEALATRLRRELGYDRTLNLAALLSEPA